MGSKTEKSHVLFWDTYHTVISGPGGKRGEAYGPTPETSQKNASERYNTSRESGRHESHSSSRRSSSPQDYSESSVSYDSGEDYSSSSSRNYSQKSGNLEEKAKKVEDKRSSTRKVLLGIGKVALLVLAAGIIIAGSKDE